MAEALIIRRGGGGGGDCKQVAEMTLTSNLSQMYINQQFSISLNYLNWTTGSYLDIKTGDVGIAYRDGQYIATMYIYKSDSSYLRVYGAVQTQYTGASYNNYLKTGDVIKVYSFIN